MLSTILMLLQAQTLHFWSIVKDLPNSSGNFGTRERPLMNTDVRYVNVTSEICST